jgi:hypothetical protein
LFRVTDLGRWLNHTCKLYNLTKAARLKGNMRILSKEIKEHSKTSYQAYHTYISVSSFQDHRSEILYPNKTMPPLIIVNSLIKAS